MLTPDQMDYSHLQYHIKDMQRQHQDELEILLDVLKQKALDQFNLKLNDPYRVRPKFKAWIRETNFIWDEVCPDELPMTALRVDQRYVGSPYTVEFQVVVQFSDRKLEYWFPIDEWGYVFHPRVTFVGLEKTGVDNT